MKESSEDKPVVFENDPGGHDKHDGCEPDGDNNHSNIQYMMLFVGWPDNFLTDTIIGIMNP
jgi:hypothetical protein